jgi:hypothetical protein
MKWGWRQDMPREEQGIPIEPMAWKAVQTGDIAQLKDSGFEKTTEILIGMKKSNYLTATILYMFLNNKKFYSFQIILDLQI